MALVEIRANGKRTGIIVDQDALQAAHDTWYANPANTKCWRCSFVKGQHAASCPNAARFSYEAPADRACHACGDTTDDGAWMAGRFYCPPCLDR